MNRNHTTLNLSATQADTLEDALLTFAPRVNAAIHPSPVNRYEARIAPEQLGLAVDALTQYRCHIEPRGRTVPSLLAMLAGTGGQA